MQDHHTPTQALSAQERTALLAVLPSVGRERAAARVEAAAVYARVSTDGQDSIPAQLQAGQHDDARRLGVVVPHELQDTGSGLDATPDGTAGATVALAHTSSHADRW
jgi:hypothetical protein